MTREELIKKVALKMDEISSSDDVIVPVNASDNNPLYTQINNLLNESINDVLAKAPIYRINSHIDTFKLIHEFGEGETKVNANYSKRAIGDRFAVVIPVPDDFIRIASINDALFQRPIVDLAFEGDDIDKKQHNKFLVAKYAKPVAVLGQGILGREITCYSYDSESTPNIMMRYVRRYNSGNDAHVETGLNDYMIDVVSWACAGRVFAAQGDINKGKLCDENASALMV